MSRFATLALLLVALVALGSCGGDEPEPQRSGEPPAGSSTPEPTRTGSENTFEDEPTTESTPADEAPRPRERDTDTTPADDDEPATRAAFIAAADPICSDAQVEVADLAAQITRLFERATKKKIAREVYYRRSARLTDQTVDTVRQALGQLEALPRPAERRRLLERYLAATAEQADLLARQARLLRRHRRIAVSRLHIPLLRAAGRARGYAHRYGFKTCGGGS